MKNNEDKYIRLTKRFLSRLSFEMELNDTLAENGLKDCSHPIKIDGECVSCKTIIEEK